MLSPVEVGAEVKDVFPLLVSVTNIVFCLPQYTPGTGYGQRGSAEIMVVCTAGLLDADVLEVSTTCGGSDVGEACGVVEDSVTVFTKVDVILDVIVDSLGDDWVCIVGVDDGDCGALAVTVM